MSKKFICQHNRKTNHVGTSRLRLRGVIESIPIRSRSSGTCSMRQLNTMASEQANPIVFQKKWEKGNEPQNRNCGNAFAIFPNALRLGLFQLNILLDVLTARCDQQNDHNHRNHIAMAKLENRKMLRNQWFRSEAFWAIFSVLTPICDVAWTTSADNNFVRPQSWFFSSKLVLGSLLIAWLVGNP